jgi:hypothetical protein
MNIVWRELIEHLGSVAILIGALAWLAKSITAHFLSRDIEAYKERLSAASAREIEHVRSQLQIMAKEHEIRFSKLHEKRAEVVMDLYLLLDELRAYRLLMGILLEHGRQVDRHVDEGVELSAKLFNFFKRNKLYLSSELAERLEELINKLGEPLSKYAVLKEYASKVDEGVLAELPRAIEALGGELNELHRAVNAVEKEFRMLLGSDRNVAEITKA